MLTVLRKGTFVKSDTISSGHTKGISKWVFVGYPKMVPTKCFKRHNKTYISNSDNNNTFNDNDIDVAVRIYINIKYSGETADRLIKQCMKKLYKCFKLDKRVKFVLLYKTTKLSHFTNNKKKFITKSMVSSLRLPWL